MIHRFLLRPGSPISIVLAVFALAILLTPLFSGCSLGLERPKCPDPDVSHQIGSTCLIRATDAEAAYAEQVIQLLGGSYPLDVRFSRVLDDVSLEYNRAYLTPDNPECVSGFTTGAVNARSNEPDAILTIPTALAHELTHWDVFQRSGQTQSYRPLAPGLHEGWRGWTEADTQRSNWARTTAQPLHPYDVVQGCDFSRYFPEPAP